jgi:hypothetical protein
MTTEIADGRPALQAMERRGFVKQHFPGFDDGLPAVMIRSGEDSHYSLTEEGYKELESLGFDLERCQAIRKEWGR